MPDLERLIAALENETGTDASELFPLVYDELRGIARGLFAKRSPGQTLQPTALVNEAYLRMTRRGSMAWKGKSHFFGAVGRAMREILIEQARAKERLKRGGDRERENIDV
ncbi:MAG: ECF-type sigma factor, partial [Planctomycetota bacterium]